MHREKFVKQHNLWKQIFAVESKVSYPPSQEEKAKFQALDPQLVKSIQYADKRCRTISSGALSASPALCQAELWVYLIQGLIKRCKRLQISSCYLQRLQKKIGDNQLHRLTLPELEQEEKRSNKEFREIKKDSSGHRDRHINKLAAA
jgi:hypothetical protein